MTSTKTEVRSQRNTLFLNSVLQRTFLKTWKNTSCCYIWYVFLNISSNSLFCTQILCNIPMWKSLWYQCGCVPFYRIALHSLVNLLWSLLLYLKETLAEVFPVEFCKNFKNTFFHKTSLVTAIVFFLSILLYYIPKKTCSIFYWSSNQSLIWRRGVRRTFSSHNRITWFKVRTKGVWIEISFL